MHNGVLHQSLKTGVRTLGMAPIGSSHKCPPGERFASIHRWGRRKKNNRLGNLFFRRKIRVKLWIRETLRHRLIASGVNELQKLCVGDRRRINLEGINRNLTDWRLLWVEAIGTNLIVPSRDGNHSIPARRTRHHQLFLESVALG